MIIFDELLFLTLMANLQLLLFEQMMWKQFVFLEVFCSAEGVLNFWTSCRDMDLPLTRYTTWQRFIKTKLFLDSAGSTTAERQEVFVIFVL